MDVAAQNPKMPVNACANDNWIGRERVNVREASTATKALASLGRACWKQVRLGRREDPGVQETGLTANSIFLAQPTADVPTMEMPPPPDALVDSFNVVFTRSLDDLSKAEWARVNRQQYMRIVAERQLQCPAFSNIKVRQDLATTRLPLEGIPEHITSCATQISGSERAPMRLDGPASKAPDSGKVDDSGQTSSEETEGEESNDDPENTSSATGAEASIAVDSMHDIKPVRAMQALKAQMEAIQTHAEKIIRNEKMARVKGHDGVLQPVADEGGRQHMQSLILDVQATSRSFDRNALAEVESFIAQGDRRRTVCPMALAIPTEKPMDSFDARTWPACFTEWWFGDGAPNLDRQRPMLFEECARRLFDLEEMEYSLQTDEMQYVAFAQSRFC